MLDSVARATFVIGIALTSACAATQQAVMLPPPPPRDASLVERDAYYEQKKPLGVAGIPNAVNQLGWLAPASFPILVLADGTKIADPSGLVPAVDPDSRTAQAAKKVGELKLLTNSLYTISSLGLSVGLITMVIGPAFAGGDPNTTITLALAGGGIAIAGAVGIGWATQLAEEAEGEKMTALLLYEPDLRRRLGLVRPDEVLEKKWLGAPRKRPAPAPMSPAAPSVPSPTPATPPATTSPPPEVSDDPNEPPGLLEGAPPHP